MADSFSAVSCQEDMTEFLLEDERTYASGASLRKQIMSNGSDVVSRSSSKLCSGLLLLLAGTIVGSTFTAILTVRKASSIPINLEQDYLSSLVATTCGDNPVTARSLNCSFDLLSFSWLPPRCYDSELTTRFAESYNWTWYRSMTPDEPSASAPIPVTKEVALLGNETELYVTEEYHVIHCIYMWMKFHRGLEVERKGLLPGSADGAWIDSYIGNLAHTEHCSTYLLDWESTVRVSHHSVPQKEENKHLGDTASIGNELDRVTTTIITKYPSCPAYVGSAE